ncbi:MAG: putative transposase [Actinomycetia bacterium]|nr:putative transposase [Actinomycetes bacterium]
MSGAPETESADGASVWCLEPVTVKLALAKKLSEEDRRGLTALFWSNINPYGTFRLEMEKRLDLLPVPGPRQTADDVARLL